MSSAIMTAKYLVVNSIHTPDSGPHKLNHAMTMSKKEAETSSDVATLLGTTGSGEVVSRPSSGGRRNFSVSSETAATVLEKKAESTLSAQTKDGATASDATPPLAAADSGEVLSGPPFRVDGNIASSRTPSAEGDRRRRFFRSETSGILKTEEEMAADVAALPLGKSHPCAVRWQRPENTSFDVPPPYPGPAAMQLVTPGLITHRPRVDPLQVCVIFPRQLTNGPVKRTASLLLALAEPQSGSTKVTSRGNDAARNKKMELVSIVQKRGHQAHSSLVAGWITRKPSECRGFGVAVKIGGNCSVYPKCPAFNHDTETTSRTEIGFCIH